MASRCHVDDGQHWQTIPSTLVGVEFCQQCRNRGNQRLSLPCQWTFVEKSANAPWCCGQVCDASIKVCPRIVSTSNISCGKLDTHVAVATLGKPYTLVLNRECAMVAEAIHQMLLPYCWQTPGVRCGTFPSLGVVVVIPSHLY